MARQQLASLFRSLALLFPSSSQKVLNVDFYFHREGPDNPLVGNTICLFRDTSVHQRYTEWYDTQ